ncbi:MAG TPA: transporter substrate-binding domain-containing protein, partial [Magnetospirillum sp.]|nr:transporter substrate-binding domain-containing protein [Magnetospirillum sp.]
VGLIEAEGFCSRDAGGNLTGFNVETARLLCQRMGASCRLEVMSLTDVISGVSEGRVQIGFGNLLKSPEREQVMLFSHPYWRSSSIFIGAPALADLALPAQLAGKRVAVQTGSRQHAWAKAQRHGAQVVEVAHADGVMAALINGDADLGLLPMVVALNYLKSEQGKRFDFIGSPTDSDGLGGSVHIVVSKDRPDLLSGLDKVLDASVRDGSLHALSRRFLPFDVY